MKTFLIWVLTTAFTLSCTPKPEPDAPRINPLWPQERQSCVREGGEWAAGGMFATKMCFPAYSDAGAACTVSAQCEGLCLTKAETNAGQCAPSIMFGCFGYFEDKGEVIKICID